MSVSDKFIYPPIWGGRVAAAAATKSPDADNPLLRPVTDIEGIGEATAEKLRAAGISSVVALAASPPAKIVDATGTEPARAGRWNTAARAILEEYGYMEKSTRTALEIWKARDKVSYLSTGCEKLDWFFGGDMGAGLEAGTVTEVYGEAGSGKSQLAYTLCLQARKEGRHVIFIESENAFRVERLAQMAAARGEDPDKVMGGIQVVSTPTSAEMLYATDRLRTTVAESKCGLIVLDSIANVFRSEMTGREYYTERAKFISAVLDPLKAMARILKIPVLLINQVTTKMDGNQFTDDVIAWGGKYLAHAVSQNAKVTLYGRRKRLFRMIDSPSRPNVEAIVFIDNSGYVDEDPEKRGKGK